MKKNYTNPILFADYSDPDVIRVNDDFFMIASSFCNTPAVPLLHSKDLVNWKVVNYIMDNLPFNYYDVPRHGLGVWAPALRFHEGIYYAFIPFPDEGILMCKTTDPFGKWDDPVIVKRACGWIDPCPFFDDDGSVYMVNGFARSRWGFKSILGLSKLSPDCTKVLDDGELIFDGRKTQPTIEGPKLYKRNGYYYIFAPAGGVKVGWQTVLRSKNIYGPYEEKIVMAQGASTVNGPHQGAWIDTPSGEDYFIHFQDVGLAGRIVHLQPMRWENDWPVIGVNDVDGCGEPVMEYPYPIEFDGQESFLPEDSDDFTGSSLGLQWQWNANHQDGWFALSDLGLTLHSVHIGKNTQLCDAPNLLLQKWSAPSFEVNTTIDLSQMKEGDTAGLIFLGCHYYALAIVCENDSKKLYQIEGDMQVAEPLFLTLQLQSDNTKYESKKFIREIKEDEISLTLCSDDLSALTPGRWVGVKHGLFIVNNNSDGGSITANHYTVNKF